MKPKVIYEDNHIIVVIKPFGMPSQEDESGDLDMLTWVKDYIKEKYHKPGEVFIGLVHRLDRVAGGLMVFARTSKAAGRLSEQIRNRTLEKTYWTVIEGRMSEKQGTLEDYLWKDKNKNKVKVVSKDKPDSKQAVLTYQTRCQKEKFSLLEVDLHTGRAHQIRVQLSERGHAIVGDMKYGSDNPQKKAIALWSYRLCFIHPTLKQKMEFSAEISDYLREVFPWNLFL